MTKQTAMQQLLAQLKDERANLPMLIEWDRCYQAIEMVIQNTYLPVEKKQIENAFVECWKANMPDGYECKLSAEQYYNQTYGGDNE
jgi:hypothetical protein